MKIIDSYSNLHISKSIKNAHPVFQAWDYTDDEIVAWFQKSNTARRQETAEHYLTQVKALVEQVEDFFGRKLPGELVLIPSMGQIDGFARYDQGQHTVMLGIDFPDASFDYLRALTAHELSHVYRDHSPEVWGFLGKSLSEISRNEYLEATSGREHLISEGLATLNSQAVFPEIPKHIHHYYEENEMGWFEKNLNLIDSAVNACLREADPDPWKFYTPGLIARGSPSHAHYGWAAAKIQEWLKANPEISLIDAHTFSADKIKAF